MEGVFSYRDSGYWGLKDSENKVMRYCEFDGFEMPLLIFCWLGKIRCNLFYDDLSILPCVDSNSSGGLYLDLTVG